MIEGAINAICKLRDEVEAGVPFLYDDGFHYYKNNDMDLVRLKPPQFTEPMTMVMNTLSGLAGFVLSRNEEYGDGCFLLVRDVGSVALIGPILEENDNKRFMYAMAKLPDSSHFPFGQYIDLESFIIKLQTHFTPCETVERIILMLAHVANDHVATATDDKFTQKLAVKTGITTKEEVRVENPVILAPWRTFREVAQPVLPFVLRLKNGNDGIYAALFEAGGEAWKLEAMQNIAEYLRGYEGMLPVFA